VSEEKKSERVALIVGADRADIAAQMAALYAADEIRVALAERGLDMDDMVRQRLGPQIDESVREQIVRIEKPDYEDLPEPTAHELGHTGRLRGSIESRDCSDSLKKILRRATTRKRKGW
jgi:hypothetical protein